MTSTIAPHGAASLSVTDLFSARWRSRCRCRVHERSLSDTGAALSPWMPGQNCACLRTACAGSTRGDAGQLCAVHDDAAAAGGASCAASVRRRCIQVPMVALAAARGACRCGGAGHGRTGHHRAWRGDGHAAYPCRHHAGAGPSTWCMPTRPMPWCNMRCGRRIGSNRDRRWWWMHNAPGSFGGWQNKRRIRSKRRAGVGSGPDRAYERRTYALFGAAVFVTAWIAPVLICPHAVIPICGGLAHRWHGSQAPQQVGFVGTVFNLPALGAWAGFWTTCVAARAGPGAGVPLAAGKAPPADLVCRAEAMPGVRLAGYVADWRRCWLLVVPLHGGGMRVKIVDRWGWGAAMVSTTVGAEGWRVHRAKSCSSPTMPKPLQPRSCGCCAIRRWAPGWRRRGRRHATEHYDWRRVWGVEEGLWRGVGDRADPRARRREVGGRCERPAWRTWWVIWYGPRPLAPAGIMGSGSCVGRIICPGDAPAQLEAGRAFMSGVTWLVRPRHAPATEQGCAWCVPGTLAPAGAWQGSSLRASHWAAYGCAGRIISPVRRTQGPTAWKRGGRCERRMWLVRPGTHLRQMGRRGVPGASPGTLTPAGARGETKPACVALGNVRLRRKDHLPSATHGGRWKQGGRL